jgi:hypothetical protein
MLVKLKKKTIKIQLKFTIVIFYYLLKTGHFSRPKITQGTTGRTEEKCNRPIQNGTYDHLSYD